MARDYVIAAVPDPAQAVAEALVAPYLDSPNAEGAHNFSVPLVPLAGPDDAAPTHYGCCASVLSGGVLASALPALAAGIPGTVFHVVTPWRDFSNQTHWIDWLAMQNLKPQVMPMVEG